jgi:MATE family multidrug resistance protein
MMDRLNKEILRLAGPSILANITIPLVGLIGIAIAGHLHDSGLETATIIGGISVGGMLFDLLYWNFGFLRIGTGGMTAQAVGRGDSHECANLLTRGVGLSFIIAFALILLQWPFVKLVFLFVKASPEVQRLASEYFFIRIWAAPASLSLMAFKGWFIGMQDSWSSMATDLTVQGVNVLAGFILTLGIDIGGLRIGGIGYVGIPIGICIAQYSGFAFAWIRARRKYGKTVFAGYGRKDIREAFRGGQLSRFVRINGDLFIRSACLVVIYIGFTSLSAGLGDLLLASGNIMMNLLLLFSYFTDGFAYAGEALTGKFIGMGDVSETRRTVKWTFVWSVSIGLVFVFVYEFCSDPLLHLLTNDMSVIETCRDFFFWLMPMPVIGVIAFTWDGIYVGATASRALRDSSLLSVIAFFAVWFIFAPHYPMAGAESAAIVPGSEFWAPAHARLNILLAAYFAHVLVRSVYQTVLYRRQILIRPFAQ